MDISLRFPPAPVTLRRSLKSQHHFQHTDNLLQRFSETFNRFPPLITVHKCLRVQFLQINQQTAGGKGQEQRKTCRCSRRGKKRQRCGRKRETVPSGTGSDWYTVYTFSLQLLCSQTEACWPFQAFSFTLKPSQRTAETSPHCCQRPKVVICQAENRLDMCFPEVSTSVNSILYSLEAFQSPLSFF